MEALGRLINLVASASGQAVSLADASGVTFVVNNTGAAAATATVQEAQDAAGTGAQNLPVIERSFNATAADGSVAWTEVDETSGGSPVAAVSVAIGEVKVIHVSAKALSDGFTHVSCTTDAGVAHAITHDLTVQRSPENLPALVA